MPRKRLKDSLPLLPVVNTLKLRAFWVKEDVSREDPGKIVLTIAGPRIVETRVQPVRAKASDVGKMQALRFVDLLRLGHKPGEAAHRMHTTVSEMMSNPDARKRVQALVKEYTRTGQERRDLIRALQNKTIEDGLLGEGDLKTALSAAKDAAEDPEVGLTKGSPTVQIDMTLKSVLSRPVEPLPGMPAELPPAAEGEVIDVTGEPEEENK